MSRFFAVTLIAGALLAGGVSTAVLADQQLPSRLAGFAQPNILDARPMRMDRDAAWPAAVVIINSQPVSEPEATISDIVLKPPIFAERNSLGAPRPVVAVPAAVNKKATDLQRIVRRSVRSRTRRAKNVRANSRQTSSKNWMNKVWGQAE